MNPKRMIIWVSLMVLFVGAGIASAQSPAPQGDGNDENILASRLKPQAKACTLGKISGEYGYTFSGALFQPGGAKLDVAAAGMFALEEDGTMTGADSISLNGQVIPRTYQGRFTINPDCTGTATLTDTLGQTVNLRAVFVDNRSEIRFVQTDPGTVIVGTAKKL
jgi:hypothetical protein